MIWSMLQMLEIQEQYYQLKMARKYFVFLKITNLMIPKKKKE